MYLRSRLGHAARKRRALSSHGTLYELKVVINQFQSVREASHGVCDVRRRDANLGRSEGHGNHAIEESYETGLVD